MRQLSSVIAVISLALCAGVAQAGDVRWEQQTINAQSVFESAAAFDIDNDGELDILSGDTWYRGPKFEERFKVRDVTRTGTYMNCFSTLPVDVNADGDTDFVTCSYFEKNVGWVQNPGKAGALWTYHEIDLPGPCEAAQFVDLTGDGEPEILPNPVNVVVWYMLVDQGENFSWKKFDFGTEAAGHGIGSGDVDGDGRVDLLTSKGWFQAPEKPAEESWTWHPEWQLGAAGIQILARDVDGDGLSDVVWGMGHDYGLFWLKQAKGPEGARTWTRGEIDPKLSSVHTLMWADLDGDGAETELLTGKRVYAHEVEPGDTDASVVAYYTFDKAKGAWSRHVIFEGEPATNAPPADRGAERDALKDFPPGTAGTGLQMDVIDIDGDNDLDLICPGKSGLYLFKNLGR